MQTSGRGPGSRRCILAGCGKTRGQTNLSLSANVESVRCESMPWTDPSVPAFFRNLLGRL